MKKKLNQSTAKFPVGGLRRLALFLFLLLGLGGLHLLAAAQTVSSVVVTPITARYNASPPTVTFKVSWPAGTRDADHRSKVWVLVDYRRIQNNAYTGDWLRAGISTAQTPTANAGSVLLEPNNDKGFWLQGTDDAFAATVTVPVAVDLTGYAPQFGWCGVASDRPPTAVEHSGYYTLRGTQPFIIQTVPDDPGSTISRSAAAYDNCIYGLTDATGCPGEVPPMPVITNLPASAISICAGQGATLMATAGGGTTTAMTYTWIVGGGAAQTTTSDNLPLSSVAVGSTTYSVTVTNENGCTSPAKTGTITVHTAVATASISGNSSNTCPAATVSLSASATGATSYTWYNGSTPVQSGTSTAYTVTSSGSYTVQGKNAYCTGTTSPSHEVTINSCGEVPGCSGFQLYQTTATHDGQANWSTADTYCNDSGARLPTEEELLCMCKQKTYLPTGTTGFVSGNYWSSTATGSGYRRVNMGNCTNANSGEGSSLYFRCVL